MRAGPDARLSKGGRVGGPGHGQEWPRGAGGRGGPCGWSARRDCRTGAAHCRAARPGAEAMTRIAHLLRGARRPLLLTGIVALPFAWAPLAAFSEDHAFLDRKSTRLNSSH